MDSLFPLNLAVLFRKVCPDVLILALSITEKQYTIPKSPEVPEGNKVNPETGQ
jgi:hypothetical protein